MVQVVVVAVVVAVAVAVEAVVAGVGGVVMIVYLGSDCHSLSG